MKKRKGGLGVLCYLALLATALLALPALLLFARRPAGDEVTLPVVMYHGVCETEAGAGEYTVSAKQLEADLAALVRAGYTPVRLSEVLAYALEGGPLPRKPVLLVFDDGETGVARWALPVLEEFNAPAVVSVIGDGAAGVQGEAGEYLTWAELAQLQSTGLVELQSHSASLHTYARPGVKRLAGESKEDYTALLAADAETALRAAGVLATMTSEEHANRLTRSPECLFLLGRFERDGSMTTGRLLETLEEACRAPA